jgi:hypothetical protein
MSVTAAVCNSYKQDVLNGAQTSSDTYKVALYTAAAATLNASTTAYTATGEISGTGYTAGGATLAGFTVGLSTNTAYVTWSTNPSWSSATITADTALIYNSSKSNKAVAVLSFTSTSSTNGTWTLVLPAAGATSTVTLT